MKILPTLMATILGMSGIQSKAEVYMGLITPMTLGEIKAKFLHAKIENAHAAWASEAEAVYIISGNGISGSIVVKLSDFRPINKKAVETTPLTENNSEYLQACTNEMNKSDDDALFIAPGDFVRWCPDTSIPAQRLITRYGKPDQTGFDENDFKPYLEWTKRHIRAYTTDDGKNLTFVTFTFTNEEANAGYLAKGFQKPFYEPDKIVKPVKGKPSKVTVAP